MQTADPFVFTLKKWVMFVMRRSMHSMITFTKEKELSMSQMGALFHILRGSNSVSSIGEHLGVTSAAASQLLERLVQQGMIQRVEDPHDRRVRHIILTEGGRQLIREGFAARQGWLENLSTALTESEKVQIIEALDILIDRTNQVEQDIEVVC
jgi:DNA-binding MarR family transcriptional regulator